jgi:RNA polymerase sigma-70 factor, ECF subfamily
VNRTAEFEALRPRLFGIAYRMTGSVVDAEDVCQDAWLRWQAVELDAIASAEAYLVRITTTVAIDRLRSAAHRRETYVGAYLPEPVLTSSEDAPEDAAELADSMTFAFLVLLDELNPLQRAVFLLRDVFGYSFDEVGVVVGRSSGACRQIASRTRRRLDEHRVELRRASDDVERRLVDAFVATTIAGDISGLMVLLADDVVQLSDGGAERHAARRPIVGAERVARAVVNLARRLPPGDAIEFVRVNTNPGVVLRRGVHADMVVSFELAPDGRIRRMFVQLNPEKLAHLDRTGAPGGT